MTEPRRANVGVTLRNCIALVKTGQADKPAKKNARHTIASGLSEVLEFFSSENRELISWDFDSLSSGNNLNLLDKASFASDNELPKLWSEFCRALFACVCEKNDPHLQVYTLRLMMNGRLNGELLLSREVFISLLKCMIKSENCAPSTLQCLFDEGCAVYEDIALESLKTLIVIMKPLEGSREKQEKGFLNLDSGLSENGISPTIRHSSILHFLLFFRPPVRKRARRTLFVPGSMQNPHVRKKRQAEMVESELKTARDSTEDSTTESGSSSDDNAGSEGDEEPDTSSNWYWKESDIDVVSYRRNYQKCWLALIQSGLNYKERNLLLRLLHHLPKNVLPYLVNPLCCARFLLDLYDQDEDVEISICALSSLFELMTKYRLGEPDMIKGKASEENDDWTVNRESHIYKRLYKLLIPSIFLSKHKSQFMQLLNLMLRSTLLPSSILVSFIKKLTRLACITDPVSSVWLLSLATLLLFRARNVTQVTSMLSMSPKHAESNGDCFNYNELQLVPDETTVTTSLWELLLISRHFYPPVAKMARGLLDPLCFSAKGLSKVDPEVFSGLDFEGMVKKETKKIGKNAPIAHKPGEISQEAGALFVAFW